MIIETKKKSSVLEILRENEREENRVTEREGNFKLRETERERERIKKYIVKTFEKQYRSC